MQLRDFVKAGVHPAIGLNGADIAIKGQFYPTTRDDSEMTADAFSLLVWGVQRQRRKPIQRPPRVSKRHWKSHDTASGDLSGYLLRAENGGFDSVPLDPFFRFGIQTPAPRPFYRPSWDNYSPTSSLR